MVTYSSELALKTLLFLCGDSSGKPVPLGRIGKVVKGSRTYLPKIAERLTARGILRSFRGVQGGVTLARPPEEITLLDVVEACQGELVGDYCQAERKGIQPCAFHKAMVELQEGMTAVLSKWSLKDLKENPYGMERSGVLPTCRMRVRGKDGHVLLRS